MTKAKVLDLESLLDTVGDLQGGIEKAERMLGYKVMLVEEDRP